MDKLLNRKSQTPMDAIYAIVILFSLAIAGLFSFYIFQQVFNGFENSTINSSVTYPVFEKGKAVNSYWDYIILALFIGFALAVVIVGYFIDVHSIFLPIYIICLILGVVVAFVLSYVWSQVLVTSPTVINTIAVNNFPIANTIINNLPLFFSIIGVLGMIATYGKANP